MIWNFEDCVCLCGSNVKTLSKFSPWVYSVEKEIDEVRYSLNDTESLCKL